MKTVLRPEGQEPGDCRAVWELRRDSLVRGQRWQAAGRAGPSRCEEWNVSSMARRCLERRSSGRSRVARPDQEVRPTEAGLLQEIIEALLPPNRSILAVPRYHHRLIRQRQQLLVNRAQNLPAVAAGQIGPANAVAE
jgi:hypothetical protein